MARFGPAHPDLLPAFFSDFAKMALDESNHLWVTWWDTYLSIYLLITHIMTGTSPPHMAACQFTHRSGICNYDIWFPLRSSGNRTSGCAKHKDLMSTITSWHLWINGVLTCPWIIRSSTKSKWNWALDSHLKRLLALPWNWHLRTRLVSDTSDDTKAESTTFGVHRCKERTLVGNLTNNYKFKPDGLMKFWRGLSLLSQRITVV